MLERKSCKSVNFAVLAVNRKNEILEFKDNQNINFGVLTVPQWYNEREIQKDCA